ncbi:DUF6786 family protein [Mucilaginibacter boryungensis]|uniref:Methane monooxygenase PmoA-like n=1 Tax=Mucilaginibacter boryungensis TaxID=768480 RepID=A0ABR9XEC7_9SPHI|nr:DUF6786 family protein [Mucilaginibacter boryungensis]MBE9665744.1 hypothetical protein [Mucilaginibacter boryungensis]
MRAILLTIQSLFIIVSMMSCNSPSGNASGGNNAKGSFGFDCEFIAKHDIGAVILSSGDMKIIVSPKYQAKVFTSTASGDAGRSFGWIHYKAFDGPKDAHMNAYGGENRLWLGPEGGRFSLFFKPGAKMEFTNWTTPAAFDIESWDVSEHTTTLVRLHKQMSLINYAGTQLSLRIDRSILLLSRKEIDSLLGISTDTLVNTVGYQTENTLTNTGTNAWDEKSGVPCIWLLDMFPPSDKTVIVVPYKQDKPETKPATTNYFGEIPPDRVKMNGKTLFFRADGKNRGKLGIHPKRAVNIAGSYDAQNKILTIIKFSIDNNAQYLNQEWNTTKPPFSGDAVNAYNDGPLADGSQMGPFYELESVSPAAFLQPGKKQVHQHAVFHFTGTEAALSNISTKTLGISLQDIKKAF